MTAPVPQIEDFAPAFWDGLKVREIRLQVCSDCGHPRLPVSGICAECLSHEYRWLAVDGMGEVHTFVWYMADLDPERVVAERLEEPYNVAVIHLDAGPKLIANVVPVSFGELAVGMRVSPRFGGRDVHARRLNFSPNRRSVQ